MRLALAALLLVAGAAAAAAKVRSVEMTEPRAFGYVLGDVFERRADIVVDADDRLVAASLPRVGAVSYWLDLTHVDASDERIGGERHYSINLRYQTFYAPFETKGLTIPPFSVSIETADGEEAANLPAFDFTMAPLRELFPDRAPGTPAFVLRPDAEPHRIDASAPRLVVMVSAAASALFLLVLCNHYAWWPFQRRPGRPFTRAYRRIHAELEANGAGKSYRASLIALHRAFDDTAHERVLAQDVDRLVEAHPALGERRADIDRFFESSRRAFFADDMSGALAALPPSALATLAADLALTERGDA